MGPAPPAGMIVMSVRSCTYRGQPLPEKRYLLFHFRWVFSAVCAVYHQESFHRRSRLLSWLLLLRNRFASSDGATIAWLREIFPEKKLRTIFLGVLQKWQRGKRRYPAHPLCHPVFCFRVRRQALLHARSENGSLHFPAACQLLRILPIKADRARFPHRFWLPLL